MKEKFLLHNAPRTGIFKYWVGRIFLTLCGWTVSGALPPDKKFVLIGAPHASNWDFPFGLAATFVFRLKTCWLGKHTLFKGPSAIIMRALGGIAIDREQAHGVVDQIVDTINSANRIVIMIAPSGTRKQTSHWRSGFYHIAHQANIPIVCGSINYKKKEINFGDSIITTGNIRQDMNTIRNYYRKMQIDDSGFTDSIYLREEQEVDE